MNIIAIKSNKELDFDVVTRLRGIVTVSIIHFEYKIREELWRLTIEDKCEQHTVIGQDEQGNDIIETVSKSNIRFSEYDNEMMDMLAGALNLPIPSPSELTSHVTNVLRYGLLLKTQQECAEGKGIYFSEVEDWEIYYNEGEARPA